MLKLFSNILDVNQKEIDRLQKIVDKINALEDEMKKLKLSDFPKKTKDFKKRIGEGEKIDDMVPEIFALSREATYRTLGQRAFDVQLMAGIALFEGKVAEQKTGEGKTLTAIAPLYAHALKGKNVHLVTVNDYLARRDAGWNAPAFKLLDLTVGVIVQESKSYVYDESFSDKSHGDERLEHLRPSQRNEAYACDITYGTNNEFGFDYLRDNMVQDISEMVQKGHNFAIVDEVDSVLIDEARTPLIISAPDTEPTKKYYQFAEVVSKLNSDTDFKIDEKAKSATLTEHGIQRVEKILGIENLYEKDFDTIHHIENALRAKTLFLKDRDYIVKDNAVTIVDEFTGRLMFGRRWSEGLHQAVEAKEGVTIQQESKTLATISFQNYFRLYEVLSGMTGTAATEAEEFKKIYKLEVVVVPTNKPLIRKDHNDLIYKSLRAKYGAIVKEIEEKRVIGQPVLVGTTSIDKNEVIATYLKRKKIPHNVLNAKNHEREAQIIADAGKPGAVTVATNMAGRGVDIVLGGAKPERKDGVSRNDYEKTKEYKKWLEEHEKVLSAGGLHIIGTERHESRRIDNQLRGRSGRQGDPGSSRFYLSLEDDLMRIFGGEQIQGLMQRLSIPDDMPIENSLISRAVESAQVKVEGFNFDMRKNLVEYDDVNNQQREIVYKLRKKVLQSKDLKEDVQKILLGQIQKVTQFSYETTSSKIDPEKVVVGLLDIVPFDDNSRKGLAKEIGNRSESDSELTDFLEKVVMDVYVSREKQVGEDTMRQIEKFAYLGAIDRLWIDHIDHIDGLREGVRLRAYGQRDPLVEFKNEAFTLFERLLDRIDEELSRRIFRIGVAQRPREIPLEEARTNVDQLDKTGLFSTDADIVAKTGEPLISKTKNNNQNNQSKVKKVGRNDPCPCGSGKKYKKCHYPQYG